MYATAVDQARRSYDVENIVVLAKATMMGEYAERRRLLIYQENS